MSDNEVDLLAGENNETPTPPKPPREHKNIPADENDLPIIDGIDDELVEQRRLNTVMLLSDMQELGEDIDLASTNLGTVWTEKQRTNLAEKMKFGAHKAAYDECYNYLIDAGRECRNTQTVLFSLKTTLNRLSEKIKIIDNI